MSIVEARTVAFTTLVFFQFFNAPMPDRIIDIQQGLFSNRYMVGGLLLGVLLQLAVIFIRD